MLASSHLCAVDDTWSSGGHLEPPYIDNNCWRSTSACLLLVLSLFVCLSVFLCLCLYVCLLVRPRVYVSVSLCICPCMSVCLSACVCLFHHHHHNHVLLLLFFSRTNYLFLSPTNCFANNITLTPPSNHKVLQVPHLKYTFFFSVIKIRKQSLCTSGTETEAWEPALDHRWTWHLHTHSESEEGLQKIAKNIANLPEQK